jgi:hypothetical protein
VLNISGATYYEVYCDENSGGVEYQLCATTSQISFPDQYTPGKIIYYGVKACQDGLGCSEISPVDEGWQAMPAPAFTASVNAFPDRVVIAWQAVPEAQNYQVWRADSANGEKVQIVYQSAVGYNDLSAVPGEIYFYWVQACNSYVCSEFGSGKIGGVDVFQVYLPLVLVPMPTGE